ncbi:thioredoxin-like domain-containing protein [Proteiniphilum sp.]|uniref:TlpA family protein disulfide reductase n=1 Tax=Proteiniphilum sp. TaxID=1926877 RepID=UPI0033229AE8
MKNLILFTFVLFTTLSYGQQQVVFAVDSNLVDKISFRAKNKFLPNDFYTEKELTIDRSGDGKYYSLTIFEAVVILVGIPQSEFQEVYLSVEDTICVSKSSPDDYLQFNGKNKITDSQYNYYSEERRWQKENQAPFYKSGTDLSEHKEAVNKWIEKKRIYFHNFFNEKTATEDFKSFFDAKNDCEYTFCLLLPLYQGVNSFPNHYMDGNIRGDYNSRLLMAASPLYIKWFRDIQKYDLAEMKKHIDQHFTGDTKEYLLSLMLGIYADGDQVDSGEFLKYADSFARKFVRSDYVDYIEEAKNYFKKSLVQIPDSVLINSHIETVDFDSLTFHSLLDQYKGKPFILDFWASWCGPCINDIRKSAEIKEFLSQNDIAYIYISIDQSRDKWATTSIELGITDLQFRIKDLSNSPLIDYLKVGLIPRYIFFNKEASIINLHGKSPLEEHLEYYKEIFGK